MSVNCRQQEFSSPRFQPAFDSSYAYLEGLSRSAENIEVVVSMGQANLDTVEVSSVCKMAATMSPCAANLV